MGDTDTKLALLWRLEMRHLLRDRRALVAAFLLPLLALPVILWTSRFLEAAGQQQTAEVPLKVVFQGVAAPWVQQELLATVATNPVTTNPVTTDPASATDSWQSVAATDPFLALAQGEVDLVVDGRWLIDDSSSPSAPSTFPSARLELYFRADRGRSNRALDILQGQLIEARAEVRRALLRQGGFDLDLSQVMALTETDLAEAGQAVGAQVGRWLTVAILLFVILGGSVVAGDTLAGEKERGTLETLLTSAVDRRQIALAKLLAILTFGVLVAGVQLVSLCVHLTWLMDNPPSTFAVRLTAPRLLLLVVLFLPLLAVAAGALLWVSGRAQSYREFHFYLLPLALLLLLPTTAAALPGASLTAGWLLLPMANLSLAIRAVLAEHFSWGSVVIAWLITATGAWWLVRSAMADVMSEDQLVGAERQREEVQLRPFERHVGGWFVGFWSFIFLALVHLPLLSAFIPQLVLNLLVVCLGGSWLLIRLYGLDARATLGLRRPGRGIWPLVWVGAPALVILNGALYQWTTELFPMSRQAVEALTSDSGLGRLSFFEMLALVAVLPAICEELAFRGVLLTGLRRRLPETQLCWVVGLAFAFFHFDMARGLPTLLLGAVLAALTLRSGSVYPAMLWHGLNNALALWSNSRGESLGTLHPLIYTVAAVAMLWVLWRVWWRPWRQPVVPNSTVSILG